MVAPEPSRAPARRDLAFHVPFALILALALGLRLWLLSRPIEVLDGRTIPDDAYISLALARAIGEGQGPLFGGAPTNGFQALYVWLMAIPAALAPAGALETIEGLDALAKIGLTLGAAFDLGALILLALLLRRRLGAPIAALFAAFVWAIDPPLLKIALNGLETSLALLFFVVIWGLTLRWPFARARLGELGILGIVIGVGALARIDLLVVGVHFAGASLALGWRARGQGRAALRGWLARNLALAGGVALGYLPWLVYSRHYTGRWYPISGEAVRFQTALWADHSDLWPFYRELLVRAYYALAEDLVVLGWAALAGGLGMIAARRIARRRGELARAEEVGESLRALALPVSFGGALLLAYVFYIYCPWYFSRYFAPITILALAIAALGVEHGARALAGRPRLRRALLAAVFAVSGAALVRLPDLGELLWGAADNRLGYRNLGLWARDRFEDGAVIGGLQSGALAYYAPRLEIVNLDGVVNEDAYWALRRRRLLDYIRAREVRYLIGWKDNIWMMANQSRGFSSNDWVHRRRIKGFRSWGFEWQLYEVLYPGREDMAKRPGWKKRARPPAEAAAAAP